MPRKNNWNQKGNKQFSFEKVLLCPRRVKVKYTLFLKDPSDAFFSKFQNVL